MTERDNSFSKFIYDIKKDHVLREVKMDESRVREKLYNDASRMVREYGEVVRTSVGKGAGRGVMGFIIDVNESHYITRDVAMDIGGKKALVKMRENFTKASNYSGRWDAVSVLALFQDAELNGSHELLNLKRDRTLWLGKDANMEQLTIAGDFLNRLEENLKEPLNNSWFGEQL